MNWTPPGTENIFGVSVTYDAFMPDKDPRYKWVLFVRPPLLDPSNPYVWSVMLFHAEGLKEDCPVTTIEVGFPTGKSGEAQDLDTAKAAAEAAYAEICQQ